MSTFEQFAAATEELLITLEELGAIDEELELITLELLGATELICEDCAWLESAIEESALEDVPPLPATHALKPALNTLAVAMALASGNKDFCMDSPPNRYCEMGGMQALPSLPPTIGLINTLRSLIVNKKNAAY